jgi:Tfp pilus assembly protein PilV
MHSFLFVHKVTQSHRFQHKTGWGDVMPPRAGFTLVEVMVSTLLFTFMAMGVARMTMMSFRTAHINVYKTTAESVAQGFIEQIKSMDGDALQRAAVTQTTDTVLLRNVLPTRSVSLMAVGATADQIDDWLVPNALNPDSLSDTFQVVNLKQVIVDIDEENGQQKTMDMWFDVEIHRVVDVPGLVYLIDLQYAYFVPMLSGDTMNRSVYVRSDPQTYTLENRQMIMRDGVNTGRMQLVTSLLNLETL